MDKKIMKIPKSLYSFVLVTLFACNALATTTSLTTFYPPPLGTFKQVSLSVNAINTTITNNAGCVAGSTAIYIDSASGNLYKCTGLNTSTLYCTGNNGALVADSKGTLHVCNNGASTIYPQQCYNAFCSYDSCFGTPCSITNIPAGFTTLLPNSTDTYNTSTCTTVISKVYCTPL